jgi:hypothetical protein
VTQALWWTREKPSASGGAPPEGDLSAEVDEALRAGYELHGDPALTGNASTLVLGQAVLWPSDARS